MKRTTRKRAAAVQRIEIHIENPNPPMQVPFGGTLPDQVGRIQSLTGPKRPRF